MQTGQEAATFSHVPLQGGSIELPTVGPSGARCGKPVFRDAKSRFFRPSGSPVSAQVAESGRRGDGRPGDRRQRREPSPLLEAGPGKGREAPLGRLVESAQDGAGAGMEPRAGLGPLPQEGPAHGGPRGRRQLCLQLRRRGKKSNCKGGHGSERGPVPNRTDIFERSAIVQEKSRPGRGPMAFGQERPFKFSKFRRIQRPKNFILLSRNGKNATQFSKLARISQEQRVYFSRKALKRWQVS